MMGALDKLARRAGILPAYHQIDGSLHACGPETAAALLQAMGFAVTGDAAAAAVLEELEAGKGRAAGSETVLLAPGESLALETDDWRLTLEDGGEIEPSASDATRLPGLPLGVHTLTLGDDERLVIVSPPMAPQLPESAGREQVWGIMATAYGLRSKRNLGLGDYEDLAVAAEALASSGAAFLGINPLHDRGVAEAGASPYSPSSRSRLETRHIAVDRIPEFAASSKAHALLAEAAPQLTAARAAELVDHEFASEITLQALRAVYDSFIALSGPRRQEFEQWRAARDPYAVRQSVYEALSERHGADWRRWPHSFQSPESPETEAFVAASAEEIGFHEWRQWIAGAQLADAQARAKAAGMRLGLYLDVAVGVRPGGAETWANRGAFAVGASLGAPPDLLNSEGQRWDLAPYSPLGLKAERYRPFRQMLQTTMARAGVVRIDHIIGFARSFWAPDNGAPGGYVEFPLDVLLALARLEATWAGCVVVGEDLGTVPDGLRDALDGAGLFGCAIMPFERAGDAFRAPWAYRQRTLASFGTHDLPTLDGWWEGLDLEIRRRLGHLDNAGLAASQVERARARIALCQLLESTWLLPEQCDAESPPVSLDAPLRDAVHILLSRSASGLVAVSLDDIFGVTAQQNVPGTVNEEPNWRRKAPHAVEALGQHSNILGIGRIMAAADRGKAPKA